MYAQSQPEVFVVGTQEFNEAGQAIGGFWGKGQAWGDTEYFILMEKG